MIAIKLRPDDSLEWVAETNKGDEVFIATSEGKSIRFNQEEARPMGRASMGVRGIRLKGKDICVDMNVIKIRGSGSVDSYGKRTWKCTKFQTIDCKARRIRHKTAKITPKTGK